MRRVKNAKIKQQEARVTKLKKKLTNCIYITSLKLKIETEIHEQQNNKRICKMWRRKKLRQPYKRKLFIVKKKGLREERPYMG